MNNLPRSRTEFRVWWLDSTDVPYGICWCGCGQETTISSMTDSRRLRFRGEPCRYLRGHQPHYYRTTPALRYRVEDCGFTSPCFTMLKTGPDGYAFVNRNGRTRSAHRWLYEQMHGPLTPSLELDHLCRNRACVNLDHLEPVTSAENSQRSAAAKLTKTDVKSIRDLHERQNLSYTRLGQMFGVDRAHIRRIVRGERWR